MVFSFFAFSHFFLFLHQTKLNVLRFDFAFQYIRFIRNSFFSAIWCPDTDRSIDIAANNDIPSVSHTAFQLISRNDINAVVITGHAAHSALFCMQTQGFIFQHLFLCFSYQE